MEIRDINLGYIGSSRSIINESVMSGLTDLLPDVASITDPYRIASISEAFEYARQTMLIDEAEASRVPGTSGKAYYKWTAGPQGREVTFLCEVFHRGVHGSMYLLEVQFGVAKDKRGLAIDVYREDIKGVNPIDTLSTVVSCIMTEMTEHIPDNEKDQCNEIAVQYSPIRGAKEKGVTSPEGTKRARIYTRLAVRAIKQNQKLRQNLSDFEKMVVDAQVTLVLSFKSKLSEFL